MQVIINDPVRDISLNEECTDKSTVLSMVLMGQDRLELHLFPSVPPSLKKIGSGQNIHTSHQQELETFSLWNIIRLHVVQISSLLVYSDHKVSAMRSNCHPEFLREE